MTTAVALRSVGVKRLRGVCRKNSCRMPHVKKHRFYTTEVCLIKNCKRWGNCDPWQLEDRPTSRQPFWALGIITMPVNQRINTIGKCAAQYCGQLRSCRRFIFHSTCACRTRRAHVNFYVRTSSFTCARRVLRAHVGMTVRATVAQLFMIQQLFRNR